MIHVVFDRPTAKIKVSDKTGQFATYTGAGDAWGYTTADPYTHDGWMPPGHYVLGAPQYFTPIVSEGFGQIPISDMTIAIFELLIKAGDAISTDNGVSVGGIVLPIGQLGKYARSALFMHGGGSNAPDPYADYQTLCKTEGCTRMYNAGWKKLAGYLSPEISSNTVVYSVIGDPVVLAC